MKTRAWQPGGLNSLSPLTFSADRSSMRAEPTRVERIAYETKPDVNDIDDDSGN